MKYNVRVNIEFMIAFKLINSLIIWEYIQLFNEGLY